MNCMCRDVEGRLSYIYVILYTELQATSASTKQTVLRQQLCMPSAMLHSECTTTPSVKGIGDDVHSGQPSDLT